MKSWVQRVLGATVLSLTVMSPAFAEKINDSFTYLRLNGGHIGSLIVGTKAINHQGKVAVCGLAWVEPFENGRYSNSVRSDLREITSQIRYSLAGKSLRFSTVKFAFVKGVGAARETDVPCIATRVAWTEAMDGERIDMTVGKIIIRK